ncbi:MAG: DUF2279 domain-containing protein [Bacteroidia bacterium]|nr:MAG: DUF2279 domain-containing protein [Bacteroidia bacterium]
MGWLALVVWAAGDSTRCFWIGAGLLYGGTYALPIAAWYDWRTARGWRFFDDGLEWKQMDKLGHAWTTYHLAYLLKDWGLRCGYEAGRARMMGAVLAWAYQATVEAVDGFFPKWGASLWDLAANTAGMGLFWVSEALESTPWQVGLRFSFHPTPYARQRPDLLGTGAAQILKDYNGQTYWLCVFHRRVPVGLALGHAAEGLLGGYGYENPAQIQAREARKWVLSVDPNWTFFLRRPWWSLRIFVAIKTPLPALVYARSQVRLVWLYF